MASKTIDLATIEYYVTAVLPDNRLIHLENVAENIAWEENENELAVRLNLTLRDIPFEGSRLSQQLKLCTIVYLSAKWTGGSTQEIFRGTIWEWEHSQTHNDAIVITCYDLLYYLQKSSSSVYFAKGKKTQEICQSILASWNVPFGGYTGPNHVHQKTLYKNKTISAMLTETLDEARKKKGTKCIIRASAGKAYILARGTNSDIWNFTTDTNVISISDKYSMVNLITRVIITGKEDKKGRPKVKATINGKTQYGILQTVKAIGSTKLAEAKEEANELLKEKGSPERTTTLTTPDLPTLRKGDLIHVQADRINGYFYVKGVSHNATSKTMQMEVEPYE